MSNIKGKVILSENTKESLYKKLQSFNIDQKMNYAVVVLKFIITDSRSRHNGELIIETTLKVGYVTPFITKNLAKEYIKELSQHHKILMFLPVENGKIIAKFEDIEEILNDTDSDQYCQSVEYSKELPIISLFNIIAYNWSNFSEKEKEQHAYNLGGVKDYHHVKSLLDNWKFTPEFERYVAEQYN